MMLEKTGEFVELVVVRETSGQRLQITVKASETRPDKFYRYLVSIMLLSQSSLKGL